MSNPEESSKRTGDLAAEVQRMSASSWDQSRQVRDLEVDLQKAKEALALSRMARNNFQIELTQAILAEIESGQMTASESIYLAYECGIMAEYIKDPKECIELLEKLTKDTAVDVTSELGGTGIVASGLLTRDARLTFRQSVLASISPKIHYGLDILDAEGGSEEPQLVQIDVSPSRIRIIGAGGLREAQLLSQLEE